MHKHVIFDAEGNYANLIICSDDDSLPDGYTKQKLRDNQYWDFETQEIKTIQTPSGPITIETV
jgi:hypothetical protein